MNINSLKDLLQSVAAGKTAVDNAVNEIRNIYFYLLVIIITAVKDKMGP